MDAPSQPAVINVVDGQVQETYTDQADSFEDMHLKADVLRGVLDYGFENPTAIQRRTITPMAAGLDVFTQAQLGTGKTGAISISVLQRVDLDVRSCQAIVLVATRETATQIKDAMDGFAKHTPLLTHACLGGSVVRLDMEVLRRGVHVAIGTPGRMLDLVHRGALDVSHLKMFILDAADQMTDRGFKDAIADIVGCGVPPTCQHIMFTSRTEPEVMELANKMMKTPAVVSVRRRDVSMDGTQQYFSSVDVREGDDEAYGTAKVNTLCKLMESLSVPQAVVFVNKKRQVDWLTDQMNNSGVPAAALHAEMDSRERHSVISDFRDGKFMLLVTSDLLARGFEADHVRICFNFDLPATKEMYVARVGRPAGKDGVAVSIVTAEECAFLKEVEQQYHVAILPLAEHMDAVAELL